jgi:hypothetical protein
MIATIPTRITHEYKIPYDTEYQKKKKKKEEKFVTSTTIVPDKDC